MCADCAVHPFHSYVKAVTNVMMSADDTSWKVIMSNEVTRVYNFEVGAQSLL